MPQAEFEAVLERDGVFFTPQRQIPKRDLPVQDFSPVQLRNQFVKLGRAHACGIQPSHQAAHTGPGEVIDGDPVLFEPLQHSDMRQTERAAAFEGDSDFGPGSG